MIDNIGTLYVLNGKVESSKEIVDIENDHANIVYEVIRIIDGVPLFFEEHYLRLKKSLSLLKIELNITRQKFKENIRKLIEANDQVNCNVRVLVYDEAESQSFQMCICKSHYPSKEEIESGISVRTFKFKRNNPNIKLVNPEYKAQIAEIMKENNVYEILLVNDDNKITEGSKSNTFFIKGEKVFTAPGEYVLKGVTRKYIIDICKKLGYEAVETLISLDTLKDMDGLFISGTSNKVLPVASVDDIAFKSSSNATVVAIREQYDKLIEGYIEEYSKG